MKITEVKITGFKSFVDGVTLPIESGLTGIVGPNGCGKSNVLEALRWVMGATSAKALRGGEMDDVIFQGTENRPSRDIAEVLLKIDNSSNLAPEPFKFAPALEIARKIRRGQGSTFRINGKEVRAKDVQLMFADASSGANSPALVRQGQVSELINARPENRRKVLEEAAGISGLQTRRHDAQNKLNATETNLERVGEIIIHMEEQISSLKKQAVRAQKYRSLQAQIRGLEMYIIHEKYQAFQKNLKDVEQSLQAANNQTNDALIEFNRASRAAEALESELKPLFEEQAIAEAILRRLEAKKFEFDRDLQEIENNLENARNNQSRIIKDLAREQEIHEDAQNAIKEINLEIEELSKIKSLDTDIDKFNKNAKNYEEKIKIIESEISKLIENKSQISASLISSQRHKAQISNTIASLNLNLQNKEKEKDECEKKLAADNSINIAKSLVEKAETEFSNFGASITQIESDILEKEKSEDEARKLVQNLKNKIDSLNSELRGLKALNFNKEGAEGKKAISHINVQSGYEKALSAALGDDLDAMIGGSQYNHWIGANAQNAKWPENFEIIPLNKFTDAPIELSARLNAIGIVSESDFDKIENLSIGLRIVTKTGKLKRWDGFVITDKSPLPAAIRFEQINRIKQIEEEIALNTPILKTHEADFANLRSALASLRDKLRNSRNQNQVFSKNLFEARQKFSNAQIEIAKLENSKEIIKSQISEIIDNLEIAKKEANGLSDFDENHIKSQIDEIDIEINEHKNSIHLERQNLNENMANYLSLKSQEEARISKLKSANNNLINWQNRIKSADERIKSLNDDLKNTKIIIGKISEKPKEIESERMKTIGEMPKIEARKKNADDNLSTAQSKLREAIVLARTKENQYNAAKEAINTAQILVQTWQERISEMEKEIWQNFSNAANDLPRIFEAELGDFVKNINLEKAQNRLTRALEEREDIGGVNLRADIELEEQSTRLSNLSKERDDLFAAVKKLKIAIDEINAEGKERLLQAFETVNKHFVDLFTTLFEGGAAHLALTETDDPLGGGLEVYACPPGKRLSSMSLMSGGEQALTATALIFAVFLSNPAPISVLDELDAPLDDANVDRFCTLLDEMRKRTQTRFICITHHPITMARMDRLFGVTMAERGVSNVVSVDLSRAKSMIDAA